MYSTSFSYNILIFYCDKYRRESCLFAFYSAHLAFCTLATLATFDGGGDDLGEGEERRGGLWQGDPFLLTNRRNTSGISNKKAITGLAGFRLGHALGTVVQPDQ
jgi:hypothetical protein